MKLISVDIDMDIVIFVRYRQYRQYSWFCDFISVCRYWCRYRQVMYEIVDIDIIIGLAFLKKLYRCRYCHFAYEIVDIDDKVGLEHVWSFSPTRYYQFYSEIWFSDLKLMTWDTLNKAFILTCFKSVHLKKTLLYKYTS